MTMPDSKSMESFEEFSAEATRRFGHLRERIEPVVPPDGEAGVSRPVSSRDSSSDSRTTRPDDRTSGQAS